MGKVFYLLVDEDLEGYTASDINKLGTHYYDGQLLLTDESDDETVREMCTEWVRFLGITKPGVYEIDAEVLVPEPTPLIRAVKAANKALARVAKIESEQ